MAFEKKETFDEVAELYDLARNDYPEALFADLSGDADLKPHARVLEIGSGTGIATLQLAKQGYHVTGVELGAQMAEVARRKLNAIDNVNIEVAAFEEWAPPAEPFELVLSATAFHWIDPAVKFVKSAVLLKGRGHLAIVKYHHVAGGDDAFFNSVQDCYERFMPGGARFRPPLAKDLMPDTEGLAASGLFDRPVIRRYDAEETYTREGYLALLSTYSDHRMLPDKVREELFACIGSLIDREFGGQVKKLYLHELILARKL